MEFRWNLLNKLQKIFIIDWTSTNDSDANDNVTSSNLTNDHVARDANDNFDNTMIANLPSVDIANESQVHK